MSSVTDLRAWRPNARRERFSAESRVPGSGGSGAASEKAPAASPAWDPYDVWLTRVKQPRDKSERGEPK